MFWQRLETSSYLIPQYCQPGIQMTLGEIFSHSSLPCFFVGSSAVTYNAAYSSAWQFYSEKRLLTILLQIYYKIDLVI